MSLNAKKFITMIEMIKSLYNMTFFEERNLKNLQKCRFDLLSPLCFNNLRNALRRVCVLLLFLLAGGNEGSEVV